MLVYGDAERTGPTRDRIAELETALDALRPLPPGIHRHGALTAAFMAAAELVQGLADTDFESRGMDARSPAQGAGMGVLLVLARAVGRSWRSGFRDPGEIPQDLLEGLKAQV